MIDLGFYFELFKWSLFSGIVLSFSTSLTSPFLILQRNSLYPHALTHLLLFSLLILSLFKTFLPQVLTFPTLLAITLVLSAFIHLLHRHLKIFEDTATSIITHLSLALSLLIAAKTSQFDQTLLGYLFGSPLAIDVKDFLESLIVFLFSLAFYFPFRLRWLLLDFEEEWPGVEMRLAKSFYFFLVTLQTIVGVKLMGVLLVPAFFVFAGPLALKLSPSLFWVLPLTALFNALAFLLGFFIAIFFDLPLSGAIVLVMALFIPLMYFKK